MSFWLEFSDLDVASSRTFARSSLFIEEFKSSCFLYLISCLSFLIFLSLLIVSIVFWNRRRSYSAFEGAGVAELSCGWFLFLTGFCDEAVATAFVSLIWFVSLFWRFVRSLNSCRFTFVFFLLDRIFDENFEEEPEIIAGVCTIYVELIWQLSMMSSLNWLF